VNQILEAGSVYCRPEIVPVIDIVPFSGRDVIVAYVRESPEKPHSYTGPTNGGPSPGIKVFIRVNDKTVLASKEVTKVLRDERPDAPPMRIAIGENERRLFQHLEEHERITVAEFAHLVNISERRATRTLVALVRAGVVRIHTMEKHDYFTLAYDGVEDSR
jgi:predicted HTH transcriptional regulator